MDKLVIQGQQPLQGTLPVSGSKNTALPLMAATLLAKGTTTIENVPSLRDVHTFSNVLRISGADVQFDADANRLQVDASRINHPEAPYELVKKMRASFYMLGALVGRCGRARVSMPGGCAWGPRPVDLHIKGMKAFGANIELDEGYVVATTPSGRLDGGSFRLEPSSVGATINLLLGAVTARGGSRIENAAMEPDVVAFGEALQTMGAQIDGLGTRTIEIQGVDALDAISFRNTPDRIELGTFMIAAAIAGKPGAPIRITEGNHEHLGHAFKEAFARTGTHVEYEPDVVTVAAPDTLNPISIETGVYPGFPTAGAVDRPARLRRRHGHRHRHDLRRPLQAHPGAAAPRRGGVGQGQHGHGARRPTHQGRQGDEHRPARERFARAGWYDCRGRHARAAHLPPRPRVRRPAAKALRGRGRHPPRGVRRVRRAGTAATRGRRVAGARARPAGLEGMAAGLQHQAKGAADFSAQSGWIHA